MSVSQIWLVHNDIIEEYNRRINLRKSYKTPAEWLQDREAWKREFTGLLLKCFELQDVINDSPTKR